MGRATPQVREARAESDQGAIFLRIARTHIASARIDAGAAEVAAQAGDYEIAFELQRDANAAWERATDALLGSVDSREVEPETEAQPASESEPASTLAGPAAALPRRTPIEPSLLGRPVEPYEPRHRRGRQSWRQRSSAAAPVPSEVVPTGLDDLLADYTIDLTRAAPYDDWVVRLGEKRAELQRAAAESDALARSVADEAEQSPSVFGAPRRQR